MNIKPDTSSNTSWAVDATKITASSADYSKVYKVIRRPLKKNSYVPCVDFATMKANKDKLYKKMKNFAGKDANDFKQVYVSFKGRPYECNKKQLTAAAAEPLVTNLKSSCLDAF
jgi:hypothetical protein